jgi:hypothetical protein
MDFLKFHDAIHLITASFTSNNAQVMYYIQPINRERKFVRILLIKNSNNFFSPFLIMFSDSLTMEEICAISTDGYYATF